MDPKLRDRLVVAIFWVDNFKWFREEFYFFKKEEGIALIKIQGKEWNCLVIAPAQLLTIMLSK